MIFILIMVWFLLALMTALFESLKDVFSKKSLKKTDEYIVVLSLSLFALPFLLPLLFFIEIPNLGNNFWWALVTLSILNIITTTLYIKAIKISDLSLTVPLLAFTPLFLLFTSPFMVGEFPTLTGLIGVILIVIGAYELNIKKQKQGYLEPFKALVKEKGPRLMLLVALIWSFSSNIDKIGIQNSSPIFWVITTRILIASLMLIVVFFKSKDKIYQISKNYKSLLPIGLIISLILITQMIAISLTLVSYVIAIKRTSIIFSVIFGFLIFKEKGIKERLIGSIIMVFGVLLIILF
jgi:uncharacterized membrane protein